MMEVTHILETMLDRVRKGEALLTDDMVDASLVAGDVLKNLLAAPQRGEDRPTVEAAEAICHRLQGLCNLDVPAAPVAAMLEPAAPDVPACAVGFDLFFAASDLARGAPGQPDRRAWAVSGWWRPSPCRRRTTPSATCASPPGADVLRG